MNTIQAKKIEITNYLSSFGIELIFRNGNYFCKSPLRNENEASFKINPQKNVWFDFGLGKGGNIIDLCMLLNNTNVKGALQILGKTTFKNDFFVFHQQETNTVTEIKHVQTLQNKALKQYIENRGISVKIAKKYVKEAYYKVNEKQYFSIAFKNDKNGFELRNKYFKGSTSPKYYTTIKGLKKCNTINIFEGFFDFLSALQYYKMYVPTYDTIILNSTALIETTKEHVLKYSKINLFLDNDNAGKQAVAYYKTIHRNTINWSKKIYPNFKDFNEYIK